jgi:glycine dehydrogenase subunit 1
LLGKKGLKEAAMQSVRKAHYLADKIDNMDRYELAFTGPFFNEFTVKSTFEPGYIQGEMMKEMIMGPLPINRINQKEEWGKLSLIAVTEANRMEEINFFAHKLEELL